MISIQYHQVSEHGSFFGDEFFSHPKFLVLVCIKKYCEQEYISCESAKFTCMECL